MPSDFLAPPAQSKQTLPLAAMSTDTEIDHLHLRRANNRFINLVTAGVILVLDVAIMMVLLSYREWDPIQLPGLFLVITGISIGIFPIAKKVMQKNITYSVPDIMEFYRLLETIPTDNSLEAAL